MDVSIKPLQNTKHVNYIVKPYCSITMADEQNDVEATSFVYVGPTLLPTNANVGTSIDCYLGG